MDGFIPVPVYTHVRLDSTDEDDLQGSACPYAEEAEKHLGKLDSSYAEHLDLVDRFREPVAKVFHLNQTQASEMSFYNLTAYADAIFARRFEGLSLGDPDVLTIRDLNVS